MQKVTRSIANKWVILCGVIVACLLIPNIVPKAQQPQSQPVPTGGPTTAVTPEVTATGTSASTSANTQPNDNTSFITLFIGFVAGFASNVLRDLLADRRQAKRLHTMLRVEIDQNLGLIREFRERANNALVIANSGLSTQGLDVGILLKLTRPIFVAWRTRVWDSQNQLLPIALDEASLINMQQWFDKLERITNIRTMITKYETELNQGYGNPNLTASSAPLLNQITNDIVTLHRTSIQLADELIEVGNLLAKQKRQ